MMLYFNPFDRIGDFVLESNIEDYTKNPINKFNFSEKDSSTNWETYEFYEIGISVYVEDKIIISIVCDKECLYKGKNIIGMDINEFIDFYNIKPESDVDSLFVSDDTKQDIYEFDDIGLQVWCENGKVSTIIASPFYDEEEE